MMNEGKNVSQKGSNTTESFTIQLTNPMLYDRLHILSVEYSVSVELLVSAAVKRLIEDIDFVRDLRVGKTDFK